MHCLGRSVALARLYPLLGRASRADVVALTRMPRAPLIAAPSLLRSKARGAAKRATTVRNRARDRRFAPRLRADPAAPAVVLSPHLDDAVLSCFSLLQATPAALVVNVFAGVPPAGSVARWDRVCCAQDSAARARERLKEDTAALGPLGVTPVQLGFLDIEVRDFAPPPALAQIDAAVCEAVGRASAVYVPAGIGGHADHVTVRSYGRALARAGVPTLLYAEMPYSVVHGWPAWVSGAAEDPFLDPDPFLESYLAATPEAAPLREARVARLDGGDAAAKLAAMRAYRSQYPALDGGANGVLTNPANHAFEVFWALGRP